MLEIWTVNEQVIWWFHLAIKSTFQFSWFSAERTKMENQNAKYSTRLFLEDLKNFQFQSWMENDLDFHLFSSILIHE